SGLTIPPITRAVGTGTILNDDLLPSVRNTIVSNLTAHAATLLGALDSVGSQPTTVKLYWGTADGGTSAGSWQNSVDLGLQSTGGLAVALQSLTHITTYFYRYYAVNAIGEFWATNTTSFKTRLDRIVIGGTNTFGLNMDFESSAGWRAEKAGGDRFGYSGGE